MTRFASRGPAGRRPYLRHPAVRLLPFLALAGACVSVAPTTPRTSLPPSRSTDMRRMPPPRSLPVPVQGVRPSQLSDTFGAARSGGRRHEGIDIFASRNTPVLAATEGYVTQLGNGGLGGTTVSVEGPAGWRHYYAHLERWGPIRQGQWVTPGTVLGYVGNSGNARSTPTHLHYGIYGPGGAINPYPLLRNGGGSPPPVQTASIPPRAPAPEPSAGRRVPAEVETGARRAAESLGAAILGEILRRAGGGND